MSAWTSPATPWDYGILCIVVGIGVGCVLGSCGRGSGDASSRNEPDSLPRMHAVRIPDSTSGPVEHVKGYRIFQAGDCTVWRFQDSVGVHYLAEGRKNFGYSSAIGLSCSVAR